MKRIFTILGIAFLALAGSYSQAQTVYASLKSGAWNAGDVWETYSNLTAAMAGAIGSGTASTSTSNPGGTHFVYIRPGHTMTMGDANRGCKSIYIAAGPGNLAEVEMLRIGGSRSVLAVQGLLTLWKILFGLMARWVVLAN